MLNINYMNREEHIHHDPNYWENLRAASENYVDLEYDDCPDIETDWIDEFDKLTDKDIELPF